MPKSSSATRTPSGRSLLQLRDRLAHVVEHGALGDLEHHAVRIDAARRDDVAKPRDEVGPRELPWAHVDRQVPAERNALAFPGGELLAAPAKRPFPEGMDEAGLLREGNECRGQDVARLRRMPPRERLGANDRAVAPDLRLVVECQLALLDGAAQSLHHAIARLGILAKPRHERLHGVAPAALGFIERHVGERKDVLRRILGRPRTSRCPCSPTP